MLVLALDTTTPAGSVALARDAAPVDAERGTAGRTHGERLPGDILHLLARHAATPRDVDLFAVCSGPGSFTGLRVGLATIQGLALASRRQVVAVPALDAIAYGRMQPSPWVRTDCLGAWMNAHRGEIFGALFDLSATDWSGWRTGHTCPPLTALLPATVGTEETIARAWRDTLGGRSITLAGIGDDAQRHRLAMALGTDTPDDPTDLPPLASVIVRVASLDGAAYRPTDPHAVQPVYVRRPDAELARDRRNAATSNQ